MTEAIDFVKTDLMPDFDFDAFNHENNENFESPAEGTKEESHAPLEVKEEAEAPTGIAAAATPEIDTKEEETPPPTTPSQHEEVDKW